MKRRILIIVVSAILSLVVVLATMKVVSYYVNLIYGTPNPPRHHVIWLLKK